jgi:ABC-2 type transport system permease protein
MTFKQKLFTVRVLAKLNTLRFFRDRLALFFGVLFPLIFLFVFGSINSGGDNVSFKVAVINDSKTAFAQQFEQQLDKNKTFEVQKDLTTITAAKEKMNKSQIDGIIVLPANFGAQQSGQNLPGGTAEVLYSHTSSGTGEALTSILDGICRQINNGITKAPQPYKVTGTELNDKSLTAFDYTFAGLLGFSIIGLGIFGPMNVFPELKKQGILRRLHTTPLKVWQYFTSTMISQAIIGLISIAVMFAVALTVFDLKVVGNYLEITLFLIFSIIMILGIGLSIGGWAKNERQAAPLGNIIVFPMLFLSGTFFPRFLMPEWLQSASNYLPLTPVIDGLRMIVTEGKHLTDIGVQLGLMAIWTVVIYIIAFRVFRWE